MPKFSDSFVDEWLNDSASDYMIARRVLTDYHPLEPEMTLQLAMQMLPQVLASGTMRRFVTPVPWEKDMPEIVASYMSSSWRRDDMSLIEYMRKSNSKGQIHQWIKRLFRQEATADETLDVFANRVKPRGNVMIAATYLSRYGDRYYGQWTLMHVPFRSLDDLRMPELDDIPDHLYYQALAVLHRPRFWRDVAAIRQDLELQAFRQHHVENIAALLQSHHTLIDEYIAGTIDKNDYAIDLYDVAGQVVS